MRKKAIFRMTIWLLIAGLIIVTLLTLIEPLQDILNVVIGAGGMDCSTPKDGYRGSCIVLRGAMLWFVVGIGYAVIKGVIDKGRGR